MRLQFRARGGHSKHGVGHIPAQSAAGPLGGQLTSTPWQPTQASDAAGSAHLYADTTVAWVCTQIDLADGQAADLQTHINEFLDQIALLNWRSADLRHWLQQHGATEAGEQLPAPRPNGHTAQPHHSLTGEDYHDSGQATEDRGQYERDEAENAAEAAAPVYVHWTPDAVSWPLCGDQFALHHTTDTDLVSCPQCTAALHTTVPQARLPLGLAEPLAERDERQLAPYWLPGPDASGDGVSELARLDGILGGAR